MVYSCNYSWLIILIFIAVLTSSLRLQEVSMPPLRLTGQSAKLSCQYDLDGDALYSIKWYKGGKEFYRYVQRDNPPIQVFPVEGVNVDKSQSDQYTVTLTQLTLASAGRYKCEVSADAPSFQTSFNTVEMAVIALPPNGPIITTTNKDWLIEKRSNDSYQTYLPRANSKRTIEVNCTSERSKPAAALEWYVNGVKVKGHHLIEYAPFVSDDREDHGDMGLNVLETSILGLRWSMIPPEEELAKNPLVFNCTAAVGSIYWQYASLTLTTRRITPESQPQKSEPRAFNNKTTIQRITMYQESQISSAQTITATNLDVAHSLSLPLFLIMWLLLPLFGL